MARRYPGLAHLFVDLKRARNAVAFIGLLGALPTAVIAQVVTDGSTATDVKIDADGTVTIGIAPASSDGMSLNRYTRFNVPRPGVRLDNRTEAARTIVNEVTGTSRTEIQGSVEVLGQPAHVIIANPNGIVIDGGRFVNTGRVALTTGQISSNSRQIAPGVFQENVVATVNGGTIQVNGGGLSGQMDAIDLIASSIRVNGPLTNESSNAGANIRLAAGRSKTEFDSSILPGNTGTNWSTITGTGAVAKGATLVEISRPSVLRANRVGIEISDKGAGVRFAGEGYATAHSFTLSADGVIDLTAAKIESTSGFSASGRAVNLDHSDVSTVTGPIGITATGSGGKGIIGGDFQLSGEDIYLSSEAELSLGVTEDGTTSVDAVGGDIVLQAKGRFKEFGGSYTATRNLIINSDDRLKFSESSMSAMEGSIQIDTQGSFTADDTQLTAFGHLLISADQIALTTSKRQTEFKAENGSLILTTFGVNSAGDFVNTGGLLQGGVETDGLKNTAKTKSAGAVTLDIKGSLINSTDDDLAIIFGAGGDVSIRTGHNIENNRGRILANGNVRLISQGDVLNVVEASRKALDPEVEQYTREGARQWWTLWIKRKREAYVSYNYGKLENTDQLAAITATGNINIQTTGSLLNRGGDINANDGNLKIQALRVETVGLGSGQVHVRKVCVLTCSYEGDGAVTFHGGQLNASKNVRIEATESFLNKAGTVFAIKDVEIVTPKANLEAALVPTLVTRPEGLYNFWASKAAWVFLRDQFGSIIADTGNVTVSSARPVKVVGGTIVAGGDIELESGQEIVRPPSNRSEALSHTVGLFSDLPLIRQ